MKKLIVSDLLGLCGGALVKRLVVCLIFGLSLVSEAATRAELLRTKFDSSDTNYVFVIAHRADWRHHPENSISSLEGAIAMGVDMVEIDVAKTKDGVFVLSHDGKLDRVSDKTGAIKDLTLAEVKSARLKMGQGGAEAVLTDERVPTLVEALEVCRGKILVNIDKFYVDPNGITDIIQKLGVAKQVVLKGHGDYASVKQSTGEPWKYVENRDFIYMPIVNCGKTSNEGANDCAAFAQWDAAPYAPPAYEVCVPGEAPLALFAAFRASPRCPRLWINTLWDSLAHGHSESLTGADFTADKVWGYWVGLGATMIQTDDPAALVNYLADKGLHTLSVHEPASTTLFTAGQYVSVSCNPTNAVVAVNEQVTFTVAVKDAQGELLPTGSVTVILDNIGAKLFVSNRVDLAKENPIKISGSLSEPGFLRVKVLSPEIANPTPYNKDVVVFSCAVDPFKFEQQYPCPEDFDSFWSAARERLAKEVPLDPQIVLDPAHANDNDFTWYHVSFATFGRRVYGHLVVPKDISSGTRLPVRVQVPGAGFGSWSNIPDVRKGYISFFLSVFPWQLETNFEPNRVKYDQMNDDFRARKLNVGTMPDTTCYHVSGIARSREDYFYYPLILGMDRAIDWLAQRPDVDPKRITYHGTSQGGAFGLFLMGLNRNFSRGVVYVPALTGQHLREQGLEDTWPWFADVARANAAYFDTGNFAARVRCPIRFAVGLSDTLCPPTGVLAAYNACTSSDKDIVVGIGMSHDVYDWIYQRLDGWEVSTTH